jgi:TolA-binding protein
VKLRELLHHKSVRYSLAGLATSFFAYGAWYVGTPIVHEYQSSFAAKEFKQLGVYGTYKKHFFSFADKIDGIQGLDQENQALSRQIASLEKDVELERSKSTETAAQAITEEVSQRLAEEAGSDLARELKAIEYEPPANLLPHQLYSLAVGYFRKQEYEQAAVILSQLISSKEDSSYQKADTQLMCAIAWYKLKHFKMASQYISQVKLKSNADGAIHRSALVWEALIAKAEGHKQEADLLVTAIISRYPHSEEATWVNRRAPASDHEREGSMVLQSKADQTESTPVQKTHEVLVPLTKEGEHHGH